MKNIPLYLVLLIAFSSCLNLDGYLLNRSDPEPEFGSFIDNRDNYEYQTVTLNDQTWMAENLRFLPAVSPLTEGSATAIHYYVYDYDGANVDSALVTSNYDVYGVLYNWQAAQSACPAGWYLPSDDDFKTLEFVLGMPPVEAEQLEWRYGGELGIKLKSSTLWYSDLGGDNSSGFNALPAGNRNGTPIFNDILKYANFWTSTPKGDDQAYYRALRYSLEGIYRTSFYRENGFSIRCLKEPF